MVNIISVKELREHFSRFKEGIEHGKSFLLVYRSRPLAELRPVSRDSETVLSGGAHTRAAVEKVRRLAGGLKLGKGHGPKEMNEQYDASYGRVS